MLVARALLVASAMAAAPLQPAAAAVIATATGVQDTGTGLSWLTLDATAGLSYVDLAPRLGPGGSLAAYRLATWSEVDTLVRNQFAAFSGDADQNSNVDLDAAFFEFVEAVGSGVRPRSFGNLAGAEFGGIIAEAGPAVTLTPLASFGAAPGPARTEGTHLAYVFAGVGLGQDQGTGAYIARGVSPQNPLPDSFATGYSGLSSYPLIQDIAGGGQSYLASYPPAQFSGDVPPIAAGFWLVQATAVPEPGSVVLLCAGLAGMGLIGRRRG